ncbi:hypothetical protein Tco_0448618 [Tanacetum coccineum]
MARCAQNAQNRAKSTGRIMPMQSSATQEHPSLIQTFFDNHPVGGVFLRDEDRHLYENGEPSGSSTYTDTDHGPWFHTGQAARAHSRCRDDSISKLLYCSTSQHESGNVSGCRAGEDDESGDDEDAGEDADS